MDYIPERQQIILLKTKQNLELFIEVLNLKTNDIKEISLNEKIYAKPYGRIEFHSIDDENFYLSADSLHFKINSNGEIILKDQLDSKISSLNHKHVLKNYIFREDLELIDLKDLKKYNLTGFFDDHFDQYDFIYFYFDDRYSIFSSSNEDIVIIIVYCKDGDDPKCFHCILKIESPENIRVLFVDKIDDLGKYYVISKNLSELAYQKHFLDDDNVYVRKLSIEKFKEPESFAIDNNAELIFFNAHQFILLYDEKIEILERYSNNLLKSISIDQDSPYKIKKDMLLYVKDVKLNYTEF
ncbi:hypothetical protein [Chryseobacterium ginsenosidimutans]|uniref:hypothetical protein n=1 Tax=Chryseobacterium ginsenosidimutans TaxID=687846 RepID=UPI0031CEAAB0